MGDVIDGYRALKAWRQEQGCDRRERAQQDFPAAADLARQLGLLLVQKSPDHYQLTPGTGKEVWLLNIYPGNCRIYMDRNRPRAPYIEPGEDDSVMGWTLETVVRATREAMDNPRKRGRRCAAGSQGGS